jgi:alpha-tubulin suppressor-like RCC1 family protein
MRRLAISRWIFYLILYVPLTFLLVRFCMQDISSWDMPGHLVSSQYFRDFLWPYLSGWNQHQLMGFPQGYFYPSLSHWLIGGLGKVFPIVFCFRLVVCLSILLTPLSIERLCKKLGFSLHQQQLSVLLSMTVLAVPKGFMGGDLMGTFGVGLVSQQFAIPIFFLYLSELQEYLNSGRSSWVRAGLWGGLLMLSHAFVSLAAFLCSLAFIWFIWKKYRLIGLLKYLGHGILWALMASAWLVPYIYFESFQTGQQISLSFIQLLVFKNSWDQLAAVLLFSITAVCFVLNLWKTDKKVLLLILWVTEFVFFFILMRVSYYFPDLQAIQSLPLHPYRFIIFPYILLAMIAGFTIGKATHPNTVKAAAMLFFTVVIFPSIMFVIPELNRKISLNVHFPDNDRILVSLGENSQLYPTSPHMLSDQLSMQRHYLLNGLFTESGLNSPAIQSVMGELYNHPFYWGVQPLPAVPSLVAAHLHWLGINTLISDEKIVHELLPQFHFLDAVQVPARILRGDTESTESYSIYRLKNDFAEYAIQEPQWVLAANQQEWTQRVLDWWTSDQELTHEWIWGKGPQPKWNPPPTPLPETLQVSLSENDQIHLKTGLKIPSWIYIKVSYFPNWHAYAEDENEIPVYQAAPGIMAVYGQGNVNLRFERKPFEIIFHWVTFLCGLLLVASYFKSWTRLLLIGSFFLSACSPKAAPIDPSTLTASQVSLGGWHGCVVDQKKLSCWGDNRNGQLGLGTKTPGFGKMNVHKFDRTVDQLSLGLFHSCLLSNGQVFCWGRNRENQLGMNDHQEMLFPDRPLPLKERVVQISAGGLHTCALTEAHSVLCWGQISHFQYPIPTMVAALPKNIVEIKSGRDHDCARTEQEIYCWGANHHGQLGNGSLEEREKPTQVLYHGGKIQSLSLGMHHSCVTGENEAFCWGSNDLGQLGDGTRIDRATPVPLAVHIDSIQSIAAGGAHTCALSKGSIFCWGSNSKGQCVPLTNAGEFDAYLKPVQVPYMKDVDFVAAGGLSTCLLKKEHYSCWGIITNGVETK